MSSSGSRGPPLSRYNERSDYNDYNKARRKNFYNNTSRRDYKSNGLPGSSSLSHSKVPTKPENSSVSESSYGAPKRSRYNGNISGTNGPARRPYGGGPNVRDNRNSYGSYGMPKGSYNSYNSGQGSSSYYGNYNSYNSFSGSKRDPNDYQSGMSGNFYNRDDSWRSERIKSNGDSRLSTSTKPSSTGTSYNTRPNNSLVSSKHSGPGLIDGDYRKDRYENSFQGDSSLSMSGGKWKSSYGSNNRSTLTGSVGSRNFSSKDRIRSYSGSSSLMNGKRSDSYYASRNSYSGVNSYNKSVDHYTSTSKSRDFVRTKTYSEDEGDEEEKNISPKELNDHYSPTQYDDPNKSMSYDNVSEIDNKHTFKTSEVETEKEPVKREVDEIVDEDEEGDEDLEQYLDEEDEEEEEEEEDVEEEHDDINQDMDVIEGKRNEDNDSLNRLNNDSDLTKEKLEVYEVKSEALNEVKEIVKIDVSDEICYPDGCSNPMNSLESAFLNLQKEFENKTKSSDDVILKYSLANPVKDLFDYPFYHNNFKSFFRNKSNIEDLFLVKKKTLKKKRLSLWENYSSFEKNCKVEREKMDQQLRIVHPVDDEMRREIDSGDVKKQQSGDRSVYGDDIARPVSNNNRRNRRHGDLVTTEAEFQEILESLGKEEDENPIVKAERVAAQIPDYLLDPVERTVVKFMDSNNIVDNKSTWAERVKFDFDDNFSQAEHELFCEGFCLFPKRFGAISRHIGGLRTPNECVVHYYTTKKVVNYKQLLAHHRKRMSKKAGRRSKQNRSRNVSQNQTPVSTPTTEKIVDEVDEYISSNVGNTSFESLSEEVFTDTGRRKRAAAPIFDTNVKRNENSVEDLQRKKQKKKKEELAESPVTVDSSNEKKDSATMESPTLTQEKDIRDFNNQMELNDSDLKNRRKGISSYWSITETNSFPELLKEHGTKWTTIADKLTTKTATMVRNYYQRNAEKNGWNVIAEEADAKLDAKFAAVIGTKMEASKVDVLTPSNSGLSPDPVVPVGTFQHSGVAIASTHVNSSNNEDIKPHIPSIKSFLTDAITVPPQITLHEVALPQVEQVPLSKPLVQPQRSSIMSLLNSESSPIKPEPEREMVPKPSVTSKESIFKNILNMDTPSSGERAS